MTRRRDLCKRCGLSPTYGPRAAYCAPCKREAKRERDRGRDRTGNKRGSDRKQVLLRLITPHERRVLDSVEPVRLIPQAAERLILRWQRGEA